MQFIDFLRSQPVMTLFLVFGLGHLIGRIRVGVVTLGPVAGVLFVGLGFGYLGFEMSPGAQAVGFALFIFSVGYQAGPRFFDVLRTDGRKYLVIALIVTVTGVVLAVALARAFDFEPGTGAGLLAGGLTSSPTLAAAQEAIRGGSVDPPEGWSAEQMIGNITTGYAITYIFGLAGLILIVKLMPALLGINLADEAKRYETTMQTDVPDTVDMAGFRAYRVSNEDFTRMSADELHELWDGFSWVRLRRGGAFIDPGTIDRLELDDEVVVFGSLEFLSRIQTLGEDISSQHATDGTVDMARVIVQNRDVVGRTLADLNIAGIYGVYVEGVSRMRNEIPRELSVELRHGDELRVAGPSASIDALGGALGAIERDDDNQTDLLVLAVGIVTGAFLGTLSITVFGLSIGLGSAGGLLVSGIITGFMHSVRPTFGAFPEAARWLLQEFGLQLFMIGVGLRAGADIVETFMQAGPQLIAAGAVVTVIPLLIAYFVGNRLMHLNPAILFGAIAGAMTSGATLSVVTGEAKSQVPALGYSGTYAFSNVFLTVAGPIVVALA